MNLDRLKYRYWQHTDWHDDNSPLEAIYCNAVDGCDPTIAVSDFEFCTGQKDKNGNLIYEGDIIKDWRGDIFKVVWLNEQAQFFAENPKCDTDGYYLDDNICFFEIIGNIHNQPEQKD